MNNKKLDLSQSDSTDRSRDYLQNVIAAEDAEKLPREVPVNEARFADSLLNIESRRDTVRILFISRDDSLLNQTTQSLDGFLNLADVFDEVHIVILRPGIRSQNPVLRVADNVWVYVATAKHWWQTPKAAVQLVRQELQFADGFRPDLIVARDPFESAETGALLAEEFGRPLQVHVLEDFTDAKWLAASRDNVKRQKLAKKYLPAASSVRTGSRQLQLMIEQRFPNLEDILTLPRYANYRAWTDAPVLLNIKEKYRQFVFIILYVGELGPQSTLHRALDASRFVLRNPRVGLVVVGDGSARPEFIKRAELLGVSQQVVFEKRVDDLASYLKTADVLLVTDTTADADELVLKGAAAGVPLLITPNTLRNDLFVNEESALITDSVEVNDLAEALTQFLNDVPLRRVIKEGALAVVEERLYEDPETYKEIYRNSIETGLLSKAVFTPTK